MSEHSSTEDLVLAPWERLLTQLSRGGWARVPAAVRWPLMAQLLPAGGEHWELRPSQDVNGQGGPLRLAQDMYQAKPAVRELGLRLIASLSVAAELQGFPTVPLFDQVVWTWWPATIEGGTPAERLLEVAGAGPLAGVVAVVTLGGECHWRVTGLRTNRIRPAKWESWPGELTMIRAWGWPHRHEGIPLATLCPVGASETLLVTFGTRSPPALARYRSPRP